MEAKISTEKVMVDGIKCRKITGWSGILTLEELPPEYRWHGPCFYAYRDDCIGRHTVVNGCPRWVPGRNENCGPDYVGCIFPDSLPKVDVGTWNICLTPGGILTEDAFQALIIWMKRSGSRLAKIRRAEADAWQGTEEVVI